MAESGRLEAGIHRFSLRVYYEDTDAGGVVYHAAYLRFAERARTETLRCLGIDHGALRARFGLIFAVRRCVVDYRAAARLDEVLEVETSLERLGGASLDLLQRITRDHQLLVRMDLRLALLGTGLRPARLPRELVDRLSTL
jgi:acyl-CoA thioester hydrolase